MGENKRCDHECTCESSLSHYFIVLGGFLRIASVIFGITFSSEAADITPSMTQTKIHLDKVIALIDELTERIVNDR